MTGFCGDTLRHIVAEQHGGHRIGIFSVCSANRIVLEAAILQAMADGTPVLIESTSNQVNQFGGYTGMTPVAFARFARSVAEDMKFDAERVLLGGDHLGPNVWQNQAAATAMTQAEELVRDCVRAGYRKIHLDASMRLADDPAGPPPQELIAERTARLCLVAESAITGEALPVYVIGTEVPTPGGSQEALESVPATPSEEAELTITLTREAFTARGLERAWQRVIAVVVQPGVEFGDETVVPYCREEASDLSHLIEQHESLVYEAHSTDYQTEDCLRRMVEDHFAVLKVGPWLTFALREGIFALARMEDDLLTGAAAAHRSNIERILIETMLQDPTHWKNHYHGNDEQIRYALKYSYSDRARYYWPAPTVRAALDRLLVNLEQRAIPLTLMSQFMPVQYQAVRAGTLQPSPIALLRHKVMEVTSLYARACGQDENNTSNEVS